MRCPIKVLPGQSPIRSALINHDDLRHMETGFNHDLHPMQSIRLDPLEIRQPPRIPTSLIEQCCDLPAELAAAARFSIHEGLITISLPVGRRVSAVLLYDESDVSAPRSVLLLADDSEVPLDISNDIRPSSALSINRIHALVARYYECLRESPAAGDPKPAEAPAANEPVSASTGEQIAKSLSNPDGAEGSVNEPGGVPDAH